MLRFLLTVLLLIAIALALYANVGDAQVTSSMGACAMAVGASTQGAQFCNSLRIGSSLWAVVFYAGLAMAALAALALSQLHRLQSPDGSRQQ